jgi:hypothetical protein
LQLGKSLFPERYRKDKATLKKSITGLLTVLSLFRGKFKDFKIDNTIFRKNFIKRTEGIKISKIAI